MTATDKSWVFEEGTRFAISPSGNVLFMINGDETKWHYCLLNGKGIEEVPRKDEDTMPWRVVPREEVNRVFMGYIRHLKRLTHK